MIVPDRRYSFRRKIDIQVSTHTGNGSFVRQIEDISPTGIRLRRDSDDVACSVISNLEIHLVPQAITTVLAARRVRETVDAEAFEFISPSFSQQMILERISGNL